jgi:hypothetical protein
LESHQDSCKQLVKGTIEAAEAFDEGLSVNEIGD